jgi:hypothetical protein
LNAKLAFFRHEPNLLNEFSDAFRSFRSGMVVIEGFAQGVEFLSV